MSAIASFYKKRRVLVTGHTGFKGSWLTHWLKLLGAEVCGISLAPDTEPNMFGLIGAANGVNSNLFNLSDAEAVAATVRNFQPEILFHLGAQSLVRRSYEMPRDTFMSNVMGTAHVLEAARATLSLRAVLIVTSDKVYRNRETGQAFVEDDALGGDDPYSASKACAEIVTESWRKSFFSSPSAARVASARAGNVFGGGDWCTDRLLPDIVRAVSKDAPVILRNPDAVRPWQHVLEALSGYLILGTRLGEGQAGFSQAWNFGPVDEGTLTVGEFARQVIHHWGQGSLVLRPDPNAPKEARTLRLDSSKSVSQLGWKPVLPLDDAIAMSVEWYRTVLASPARAPEITTAQIQSFTGRLEKTCP